jgi:hypothetical protein
VLISLRFALLGFFGLELRLICNESRDISAVSLIEHRKLVEPRLPVRSITCCWGTMFFELTRQSITDRSRQQSCPDPVADAFTVRITPVIEDAAPARSSEGFAIELRLPRDVHSAATREARASKSGSGMCQFRFAPVRKRYTLFGSWHPKVQILDSFLILLARERHVVIHHIPGARYLRQNVTS